MESKRSYAKKSYKSKPSGIRFNLELERIALMRSKKETRQQLVDFLLENYVKGENPVAERYDPLPEKPYVPPQVQQPKISQYDAYYIEIKSAKSLEEIPVLVKAIKEDTDLVKWQQDKLEKFAIEHSKTFDF